MLYSINGLTKTYHNRTVLDIPSLHIERGGIHALLGPNGAGKTTLLNILGFLESPSTGDIVYESKVVQFYESYLQDLRKTVVLIDQQPILFSTSVYKNVEFGLKVRKIPKKDRPGIVKEALDLVGMEQFLNAPANTLSSGETQRVAIAQALAVLPNVLLCDEPTSSVDIENQVKILNILKQINKDKKITVIFTTHDRFQAAFLAQHTLFLDHGQLTTAGYENRYTAFLTQKDNQQIHCRIQDSIDLLIPLHQIGSNTGKAQVMIDPEKVSLCHRDDISMNSACWEGRVVQITDEKDNIRIIIDLGVWISMVMLRSTYQKSYLLVGERVYIQIPPSSIRIV